QLPPQVGTGATWRGRWTMKGTTGATVQAGDAGLANAYGDTTYDINRFTGSGTAVYSPDLSFSPAAIATPYVATSGKNIGFTLNAVSDGSLVLPTAVTTAPTIAVNG